jgi:hypothetical protein
VGDSDEVFFATPMAGGGALVDLARSETPETSNAARVMAMMEFLDNVLFPESAIRFAARLRSPEHTITGADVVETTNWLISEVYAARPTQPPSSSPDGSSDTGTSSTEDAPSLVSTP